MARAPRVVAAIIVNYRKGFVLPIAPHIPRKLASYSSHDRGRSPFPLIVAALLIIGALGFWGYRVHERRREARYDVLIDAAARRHGLDPCFLKALIWRESGFNPNARGSKGESGLTQIGDSAVKDWSAEFGRRVSSRGALFNPMLNIEIGAWYLARATRRWQDYAGARELALAEYNAGLKRLKERAWVPPERDGNVLPRVDYRDTRAYIAAILGRYAMYRNSGGLTLPAKKR